MSESTASDVDATNFAEVHPEPVAHAVGGDGRGATGEAGAEGDAEALEVDVEPLDVQQPVASGFQAFLQNANLHNVMQIESLSRTTGVFEVLSRGRVGYLHLARGELVHAELGDSIGEPAALEILSWSQGQVETCARPLATTPTVQVPLQALLLQLAQGQDEAVESVRRPPTVRSQVPDDDKPTEPHLPAPSVAGPRRPSAGPALPPRPGRLPPPLPPRIERDVVHAAEVVLSPSGDLVQSSGSAADELAARVAYAARLAELIGKAIRSGAPRGLELSGKGTRTSVKWQPDGNVSASLEQIQSPKMR